MSVIKNGLYNQKITIEIKNWNIYQEDLKNKIDIYHNNISPFKIVYFKTKLG